MLRILWDLHQHVATCYTLYFKNRACLSLLKYSRRVGGGGLLNKSLVIKALLQVVGNLSYCFCLRELKLTSQRIS